MKLLFRFSIMLLALLLPATVSAYDFEVNGIYYNINGNETSVVDGDNKYTGDVTIPETVTHKGITYSVTSIDSGAFAGCSGLTSINIGNSITSIGSWAFSSCSGLTNVNYGSSVTVIGDFAFSNCSGLVSIDLPNSITSIGWQAFSGCSSLANLTIPNSVIIIGEDAFYGTTWFNNQPNGIVYAGLVAYKYKGTMPSGTSITLEEGTKGIASFAFSNCSGLISINIPNSVTNIGESAFSNCTNLDSVHISDIEAWCKIRFGHNPLEQAHHLFLNGEEVTNLVIPNSVTSIGSYTFYGCTGLTSINIPNSVTTIGSYTFYNCSNLDNVTISDSVTYVGVNAFGGSTPWPENLPDGVVYIGLIAYKYNGIMPAGTSISLREGTTSIAGSAFNGCSGLVSINIPNSVTSIGNNAFQNCSGLVSINIPNSVTSIGNNAFQNCSGLTTVNIGNSLTHIGRGMFLGCIGLTSINIPNSVTGIGDYAFEGCSGLTSINIPCSVTSIGEGAFRECSGLTRVDITDIAAWCNIRFHDYGGANPLSYAHHLFLNGSEVTDLDIPDIVTYIGDDAFLGCTGLTSVNIPNSVTGIGERAFLGCNGLTSVTLGKSITSISNNTFSGCTALDTLNFNAINCADFSSSASYGPFYNLNISTINIGDSVQRIPSYFATGLTALTNLTIGKSVTNIGNNSFTNCSGIKQLTWNAINCSSNGGIPTANIEQVTIGDYVQTIPQYFVRNSRISEVIIPNSVTNIGSYAFQNCGELSSIDIPSSVTGIEYGSFQGCTNLTRVNITDLVAWCNIYFNSQSANPLYYAHHLFLNNNDVINLEIPNTVTNIKSYAFINCSDLTNVFIPNSITNIGGGAFTGCTSIKQLTWNAINCSSNGDIPTANIEQVTIGNEVQVIPNNFVNGSKIAEIVIPNTVTNIGYNAFYGCSGLASLTIGNSVTDIGSSAFSGCSGLTGDLNIPNSVTNIENNAFYGCSGLASLTIGNSVTDIGSSAFSGCSGLTGDLNIPNSVTNIENNAFYGCSGLASLTIGDSVTDIGSSAFFGCTGLIGDLTIPASVVYINTSAFQGCTGVETLNYNAINCADFTKNPSYHPFYNLNISTINIGDSVQRIPAYFAYGLQKLSSVTIPGSVTSVGTQAFYNCPIIESVTCLPTTPPSTPSTGDMALFNTNVYIHSPLYAPMGTEKSYMYDQGWGQFINIIGIKTQDDVLATDIMLDQSVMSLILGTSSQLVATVLPDSTTNKVVSWASSNPNVATVDENGVVTAMGLGNAMITAITTDGSNLSATCRVIVTSVSETNGFAVADAEVMHGKEIVIPVAMNNDQTILAFQTDIYLPEGFSIVMDEYDEYMITPSSRLTEDHILMANEGNGAVSVVCYTPEGRPIGGNSGDDLFYITVQVPENASGDYAIYLRNSRLTTADYTELRVPDVGAVVTVKSYIPGDANDSRTVTVTDIVVTAQYVLQMNPEPFVFEAADMNGDGEVTVTDIMLIAYLINHPTMNAPQRMPALEGGYDSMSSEDVTLMAGETRTVSITLDNEMDYIAFQLDLTLPAGLTASNFQLTDRAGSHTFDVNTLSNGKTRALCYSPAIEVINGHEGALLTFDVTATDNIKGIITVDDIELVTTDCQTVRMNSFTIGVNSATRVNELNGAKTAARVDYFNLAGQQIDRPGSGVTLVVTTYTDGTSSTTKVIK